MKAIIKPSAAPGAAMAEVPVPTFKSDEVLVKVKVASMCGTDVHIYNWDSWAQGHIKPPMVFGHEFAGHVVAIGDEVTNVKVGDFVSAETHIVCGKCVQCLTGQQHVCQEVSIIGVDRPGAFAEYIAIPASNAWKNPANLPLDVATIQEPLGNAIHTVLADDISGKTALVVGCGPIGLMSIQVAKVSGATAVYATDINEYRLDLARQMGADLVINSAQQDLVKTVMEASDGLGVDALLEVSGSPIGIRQGLKTVRNGGWASLLGIPSSPVELDLANDVVMKGVTIYGITGRLMYDNWFKVRSMLQSGRLDISPIITHHFPLEKFDEGMEVMKSGYSGKIVFEVS